MSDEQRAVERCECGHPREGEFGHDIGGAGNCGGNMGTCPCTKYRPESPTPASARETTYACPYCMAAYDGAEAHICLTKLPAPIAQSGETAPDFEEWWTGYMSNRSIDPFPNKASLWNAKQAAWSAWHAAVTASPAPSEPVRAARPTAATVNGGDLAHAEDLIHGICVRDVAILIAASRERDEKIASLEAERPDHDKIAESLFRPDDNRWNRAIRAFRDAARATK